jgi:hypothetical protein
MDILNRLLLIMKRISRIADLPIVHMTQLRRLSVGGSVRKHQNNNKIEKRLNSSVPSLEFSLFVRKKTWRKG